MRIQYSHAQPWPAPRKCIRHWFQGPQPQPDPPHPPWLQGLGVHTAAELSHPSVTAQVRKSQRFSSCRGPRRTQGRPGIGKLLWRKRASRSAGTVSHPRASVLCKPPRDHQFNSHDRRLFWHLVQEQLWGWRGTGAACLGCLEGED